MNFLSVDFDYFLPNLGHYDWGADENNPVFYDAVWYSRVTDIDLMTKAPVLTACRPDPALLTGFWDRVLVNSTPDMLFIADRHMDIWPACRAADAIWNFDQHADTGYSPEDYPARELNSGNWAADVDLDGADYTVVYPPWRIDHIETFARQPDRVVYQIPEDPPDFDVIFVCRSSAWVPSWCDRAFADFVGELRRYKHLWADRRGSLRDLGLRRSGRRIESALEGDEELRRLLSGGRKSPVETAGVISRILTLINAA